jgi:hypothetical protein
MQAILEMRGSGHRSNERKKYELMNACMHICMCVSMYSVFHPLLHSAYTAKPSRPPPGYLLTDYLFNGHYSEETREGEKKKKRTNETGKKKERSNK